MQPRATGLGLPAVKPLAVGKQVSGDLGQVVLLDAVVADRLGHVVGLDARHGVGGRDRDHALLKAGAADHADLGRELRGCDLDFWKRLRVGVRHGAPHVRASLVMSIYGGTNEIQREIVAKTYGL